MADTAKPIRLPGQPHPAALNSVPDPRGLQAVCRSRRPWLALGSGDWEALVQKIRNRPAARRCWATIERMGEKALTEPVPARKPGHRFLSEARASLQRLLALALLARVDGRDDCLDRARREILAASRLPDWNPAVPIDMMEMALGVALAFDWLHDLLDEETRAAARAALWEKALGPSLAGDDPDAWMGKTSNQNQVAHAGAAAAALALADSHPGPALRVLRRAVIHVRRMAVEYAPDGACSEGIMYWDYGTSFHGILCTLLARAFGSSFGLDMLPGLRESGQWVRHMRGPSGKFFCYSDCLTEQIPLTAMHWLARLEKSPALAAGETARLSGLLDTWDHGLPDLHGEFWRLLAFILIWLPDTDPVCTEKPPALHWKARGVMPAAAHRTASGAFAAIKGGCPRINHAHLDTGTFVADLAGQRWIEDPGMQHYAGLETAGLKLWDSGPDGDRWRVFRTGAESHSILFLDGRGPDPSAAATFLPSVEEASVLDLTAAYRDRAARVRRGIQVSGQPDGILIRDEWQALPGRPLAVRWQILTPARVTTNGTDVILRIDGITTRLAILHASSPGRWKITPAAKLLAVHDDPAPGLFRVEIHLTTPPGSTGTLTVGLSTEGASLDPPPPLAAWITPETPVNV